MTSGAARRLDSSSNNLLISHHDSPLKRCRHYLFSFILLQSLGVLTVAQSPVPVTYMAYASVNGKLYVQGGATDLSSSGTSQLFSLDLDQNWSTSSPPWEALSIGTSLQPAPIDVFHSMTVSKDNKSLIVWGLDTGISVYNIPANSWTVVSRSPIQVTAYSANLHAITDPNTGLIYIPSGSNNNTAMAAYNPATNLTESLPTPMASTSGSTLYSYGATWSTLRGSILLYGGDSQNNTGNPQLVEYVPGASTWNVLTTSGTSPGDLSRQCMIPAYGGTKIILFGGVLRDETKSGSVYILDVQNLTWSKGTDIDSAHKQTGMACAVSGDNLIAWGGTQSTPVIYNIKDDMWVNSTGLSTESPSGSNKSSGTSRGAIIGGAVAAVVVVSVIGLFFYRRRKNAGHGSNAHDQHPSVAKDEIKGQDIQQPTIIVRPGINTPYDSNTPFTNTTLPEILSSSGHVMAMRQLEYLEQQPMQPIQPPRTVQSMTTYENHGSQYYMNPSSFQQYGIAQVHPANSVSAMGNSTQHYAAPQVYPVDNVVTVDGCPQEYVAPHVYLANNMQAMDGYHVPNNPHSILPHQ
ncbi:hypothetical protein BGX21_007617 [Mortierella sp. AD011]|nr:hypothetical protein BGX21_007617 [Mortierella sp. AD011]